MTADSQAPKPADDRIRVAGDPGLRTPCVELLEAGLKREEVTRIARSLLAVMPAARGVGLAANQIGLSVRMAALGDRAEPTEGSVAELYHRQRRTPFDPYVIVDPVLEPRQAAGYSLWFEGCLSLPGYAGVVPRWNEVLVNGRTPEGAAVEFVARGWHARILQHEVDHLDGDLYTDHVCSRTFMHKDEHASRWRGVPIDEVLRALNAPATAPHLY